MGAGRRDLGDRLARADLVAGTDQGGYRDPGLGDRRREGIGVDPAEPVHRDGHGRPGRHGVRDSQAVGHGVRDSQAVGHRVQHRRVFDRRVHHGLSRTDPRLTDAEHPGLHGGCATGAEEDLVCSYPQFVGDRTARRVEELAGPAARRVELARVGPAILLRGLQRLPCRGMQRRAGSRVEVGHAHHGSPTSRGAGMVE
jgi:hypothetical protein